MKRQISKKDITLLQREISFLQQADIISTDKVDEITSLYEVKENVSFIRVLVVIGAVLIGAGVLTFIAGNWGLLPNAVKFIMILLGLVGFYVAGFSYEHAKPKTSRSLYYTGIFMYGAGIFLIGQMFHLASDLTTSAFALWALGILPLAIYLRDRWIGLAIVVLMFVYSYGTWETKEVSQLWPLILFAIVIYWMNERVFNHSKVVFFLQNGLTVYTFCLFFSFLEIGSEAIPFILLVSGLFFRFFPSLRYQSLFQWQAALCYGSGGIMLTIAGYWKNVYHVSLANEMAVLFTLLLIGFVVYLLKRGDLAVILVVCALIVRFYIDFTYNFLPKSLFFIVGGLLLIGFGYWFEKQRRKGRESHESK